MTHQAFFSIFLENNKNQICHSDRIAPLTAPCASHKNFNVKLKHFAKADAATNPDAATSAKANTNPNAEGSTTALLGLHPGELKIQDCLLLQL